MEVLLDISSDSIIEITATDIVPMIRSLHVTDYVIVLDFTWRVFIISNVYMGGNEQINRFQH